MYLSARSTSKYRDHLKFFVELCSTKEIISQSALEKPEERALGDRNLHEEIMTPVIGVCDGKISLKLFSRGLLREDS